MLEVDSVTLSYETGERIVVATDRVSFTVRPGERLAVLGPSGCGKSSLLKAIGGFVRPAAGAITLHGNAVGRPGPDRIMVFQEFDQLLPWYTVKGNVMFPLRVAGRFGPGEAERRADAAIERVGLGEFAGAYPHTLSGGMKQRVAVARATAMEPELLLMDEPFAALDALTRSTMQDELCGMWDRSRAMLVFVTHSIEEAIVIGDRIVVLSARPGRAIAELRGMPGESRTSAAFTGLRDRLHRLLEPATR